MINLSMNIVYVQKSTNQKSGPRYSFSHGKAHMADEYSQLMDFK